MIGKENAMLFSNETIGHVFTVENERHKYITKDMRKETLEKNHWKRTNQMACFSL